jgi:hypothetical protein
MDPLAEISRRFFPYTYGDDNSIRNVDVDGMWTADENGYHSDSQEEAQAAFKSLQQSLKQPPKKKNQVSLLKIITDQNVKDAPHLKPLKHWWQRALAYIDGGRDIMELLMMAMAIPYTNLTKKWNFHCGSKGQGNLRRCRNLGRNLVTYLVKLTVTCIILNVQLQC